MQPQAEIPNSKPPLTVLFVNPQKTLTIVKNYLLPLFLLLSAVSYARVICDTTCHAPDDGISNYAVVSPVGRSMVQHIDQAPRLTTLDNKTIAVVGVSFMAHITHPEIKRLIEANYKNRLQPVASADRRVSRLCSGNKRCNADSQTLIKPHDHQGLTCRREATGRSNRVELTPITIPPKMSSRKC